MVYQNLMQDRLNFWKPNVFLDVHVPLLVFEANIIKKIRKDYRISKTDFTVLAAGHLIEKGTAMREFSNPKLTTVISGISRNVVFECLLRLQKHGLITVKRCQKNRRTFKLTDKGISCINSYVQAFSLMATIYEQREYFGRQPWRKVIR